MRYLLRILLFSLFRYSLLILRKRFINVSIDNLVVSFYVETLNELIRAKSLSGERKVISFLLNEIKSSDIVMDVGANIGTHSILFSKKCGISGKVFSIEPNALSASRLKENIKLNNLSNIKIFNVALGKTNKQELLSIGEDPSFGKSKIGSDSPYKNLHKKIDVVMGDKLISENNLEIPNIIKIDVEGYEREVILGLDKILESSDCRVVMVEFNSLGDDDLIEKKGFEIIYSSNRGSDTHRIYRKSNSS